MKKVLIITYYWPPAGGPGVQRILKFVKYLKEFGWQPIVVTPEDGTFPSRDESLLEDIPKDLKVVKTKTFEPFTLYNTLMGKKDKKEMSIGLIGLDQKSWKHKVTNYIRANYFIPDARKGWNKYALKACANVIKQEGISAIITTGPPQSTHLIGLKLKRKFKLPWIADFRDPWVNVFYNHFFPRTDATEKKDLALETLVLKSCDGILAATQGIADEFKDRAQRYEVVHNGFDESDVAFSARKKTEKFSLVYTGNYKPNQDVPVLWEVLEELIASEEIDKSLFELRFVGKMDPGIRQKLEASQLNEVTHFGQYVPHHVAVQEMQSASMLLFVVPNESNNKLIITGKLFEYLASLSPLLSIGPKGGNADSILQDIGRKSISDYSDKEAIKSQIVEMYSQWKANEHIAFQHDMDARLASYSRKELTRKLAQLLDQFTSENN